MPMLPANNGVRIAAVVAPNGVGHLRRVVGVLSRLQALVPGLHVDVICGRKQVSALAHWDRARALWEGGARVVDGVTLPGVTWSPDPRTYDDGRLAAWEERLRGVEVLETADLVVSDN